MTTTDTAQPISTAERSTGSRTRALPSSPALAMLVLRLAIGAIFVAHGAQKLFFYGFAGTSGSFAQMGVPLAEIAGPLIGLIEFVGGIALVLGIATRIAAAALALDMIVAVFLVHLPFGIFAADGGYELPLALIGGAVALVLAGAGRNSLDALVARR
jgi:putative oxidoreductase